MVGIVKRSAKLMELADLFSCKAKNLLSGGVGSCAANVAHVMLCHGNAYPSRALGFELRVPAVMIPGFRRLSRVFSLRYPTSLGTSGNPTLYQLESPSEAVAFGSYWK